MWRIFRPRDVTSSVSLSGALLAASLCLTGPGLSETVPLVAPQRLVVEGGPTAGQQAGILAARRYATFWQSGDPALARAALAPDFVDRTPPAGRKPGLAGPLEASRLMHEAIPDLSCVVEQMIVSSDHIVVHLHFRGHFTGTFPQDAGAPLTGHGQQISFLATDIYRIVDGRIAENWHLEDNLTLLQQLGVIAP
jgi:predicted ester cyclase